MLNRHLLIYVGLFILASLALLRSEISGFFGKNDASTSYPGFVKTSSTPKRPHEDAAYQKGKDLAIAALAHKFDEAGSVWKTETFERFPKLKEAILAFLNKERGQSITPISLEGRRPEELHSDLIKRGFSHERHPLFAGRTPEKQDTYWRRDGSKTQDPSEPNLVPHDIYVHPDGGLVRVKPEGVPNPTGKSPRPQPHVTKSVLLDLTVLKKKGVMTLDTDFRNEAFKVTADNRPIPKTPAKYGGLFIPSGLSKAEKNGYIGYLMDLVHFDLAQE